MGLIIRNYLEYPKDKKPDKKDDERFMGNHKELRLEEMKMGKLKG